MTKVVGERFKTGILKNSSILIFHTHFSPQKRKLTPQDMLSIPVIPHVCRLHINMTIPSIAASETTLVPEQTDQTLPSLQEIDKKSVEEIGLGLMSELTRIAT